MQSSESVEDLLKQLDATAVRGREQAKIRPTLGPRIPHLHDHQDIEWKPLPKLDQVRDLVIANGGASRRFSSHTKNTGDAISTEPKYLVPKSLSIWKADRVVMPDRSFTYPNQFKPYRFHEQSDPLPETTDDMLQEQHQQWLKGHKKEFLAKQYPVVHALDRVAKYQKMYEVHREMREKTVDLLTKDHSANPGSPKMGEKAKRGLAKVSGMVAAKRNVNKLLGIDNLKDAEAESMKKLIKAKSAPVLQHIEPLPEGRISHLRGFKYTTVQIKDHHTGYLRTSTPWQHEDEIEDLKNSPRLREAMFRKTM